MADAQLKRLRSEDPETSGSDDPSTVSKRPNTYGSILSLQDEDDDARSQDITDIFSTLKQEISTAAAFDLDSPELAAAEDRSADDEDGAESVMRRLLEASDDELGIPSAEELLYDNNDVNNINNIINSENVDEIGPGENLPFAFVDNLWELEDVAANYYAMLQSELFI